MIAAFCIIFDRICENGSNFDQKHLSDSSFEIPQKKIFKKPPETNKTHKETENIHETCMHVSVKWSLEKHLSLFERISSNLDLNSIKINTFLSR